MKKWHRYSVKFFQGYPLKLGYFSYNSSFTKIKMISLKNLILDFRVMLIDEKSVMLQKEGTRISASTLRPNN